VYMYDPENPERAQSVPNPAAPVMEEGPTPRLYGPDPNYIGFKPRPAGGTSKSEAFNNRFSYAEGELPPPTVEQQHMLGYAEGEVLPPTVEQQRVFEALRQEHDAVAGRHPRDKALSDALNRDMGRYIGTPYGPIYQEPSQRISYKPNQAIPTNFLESW